MRACGSDPGREPPVLSLVFPTYNPGRIAERAWAEAQDFLGRSCEGREVIFVCDGCTDGTAERLAAWAQSAPDGVRVLAHTPNRGKGYAVRRGLAAARGRYRLFTDIDMAYGFDDVLRVTEALRGGADVAIASRGHPDSRLILPASLQGYAYRRHLQSMAFSALVRLVLPLSQRDTQAGLKGLSARAADLLLPRLRSDGFAFDCELLTASARLGLTVAEVPVSVRYHDAASTTGVLTMSRMIRELWRIRRDWSRQRPAIAALPTGATAAPDRRAA